LFIATDGNGLLAHPAKSKVSGHADRRSFYALVADAAGAVWAAGPGTGLCKVGAKDSCYAQDASPFDGDLFAVGATEDRLIAFGSTGVLAFDTRNGACHDVAATFGLEGITAELNVVARDRSGALWFGCSKGLVRLRPGMKHFNHHIPTSIISLAVNGEPVPIAPELRAPHDRNTVSFRFTGPHFADPGAVRFQYRLLGLDERAIVTRDREVTFAALRPGVYTFQVRGFIGGDTSHAAWSEIRVVIDTPWWQRTSFIIVALLAGSTILFLLLRARDRRMRYHDRLEKEKVRFQLDALRSQVDPHFLFNSFNALVELIETAPERAVEHVEQLSIFFRNILQVRERERITVDEELGLLANYFALEQRRFGDAIALDVHVNEDARARGIVPLTLQLLVENALKHNVVVGGSTFTVRVTSIGDTIVVSNPLRPRSSPPRSTGFGLHSITTRYAALTDHPIEVRKDSTDFTVRIPLIDPAP
jgi:Histidine kinase